MKLTEGSLCSRTQQKVKAGSHKCRKEFSHLLNASWVLYVFYHQA